MEGSKQPKREDVSYRERKLLKECKREEGEGGGDKREA